MKSNVSGLTRYLARSPAPVLAAFAIATAFSTYFCMYAFRKPWSGVSYTVAETAETAGTSVAPRDMTFWDSDISLKIAFAISQTIGYALSKFLGIKICSEVTRRRRALMLVTMIALAEAALLLFAVLPTHWKWIALFANGLPLGMVWGLVVWYLEGRRMSEILLAGLSCSYIVASGIVKDIGRNIIGAWNVDMFWMPAVTGGVFLLPFLASVYFLNQMPPPDEDDVDQRTQREPMDRTHRHGFVRQFLPGLVLLVVAYFFLTAYRDFRDVFGSNIFDALGEGENYQAFTQSETAVGIAVMFPLALLFFIRNNRRGLIAAFVIMISGLVLLAGGTLLLDAGRIDGMTWMITVGVGAYLAYVPFGSVLFDRLIASTRVIGTAVFAIYIADAFGYAGAISVMFYKEFGQPDLSWLEFFRAFTYFMSILGTLLMTAALIYLLAFHRHYDNTRHEHSQEELEHEQAHLS